MSQANEDEDSDEKADKKRQIHCHCPVWKPSAGLVESMGAGQPYRRYNEEMKRKRDDIE